MTPKQQRFVEEYLVDLNATQAAIRAGYSAKTAGQIGEQNLKKLEIAAAIAEAKAQQAKRTEITADRVLAELAKIGFARQCPSPDAVARRAAFSAPTRVCPLVKRPRTAPVTSARRRREAPLLTL